MSIEAGILYIVATPLGNLGDITQRAIDTLKTVDLVAAEDTRHSGKLLQHYGIDTPTLSVHEHNEQARIEKLLTRLQAKHSIALISDAGTPLISDPGYRLVAAARAAGIKVVPIPGPSALITALCAAGLPTDRFVFEGFLPAKSGGRQKHLQELAHETRTLIFYESSHRIVDSLNDMREMLGGDRDAVVARELTKTFETIHSGTLDELCQWVQNDNNQQKGEFVVLIKGKQETPSEHINEEARKILTLLLAELPLKTAARITAEITGEHKNKLYQLGLEIKGG